MTDKVRNKKAVNCTLECIEAAKAVKLRSEIR